MKYRIWTNGKYFSIQRKKLFIWVWFDICNSWCNWYGKEYPKLFSSKEAIKDFIKKQNWHLDGDASSAGCGGAGGGGAGARNAGGAGGTGERIAANAVGGNGSNAGIGAGGGGGGGAGETDSDVYNSLDWQFDNKSYLEYEFYKICAYCGAVFYDGMGIKSISKKKGVKDEMKCQDGSGYWYCSNCKNKK